jgi:hypothetical protein
MPLAGLPLNTPSTDTSRPADPEGRIPPEIRWDFNSYRLTAKSSGQKTTDTI